MNYQIIKNKELLLEFIEWLPELLPHEKFYCSLLARRKYVEASEMLSDKISLKRFMSDKKYLYRKIKQLEVEVGAYTDNEKSIPENALALYITPNPRDLVKATKESLKKFADLITQPYNGYNPHSEVLSALQSAKSCSRKVFYDLDYDNVNVSDFLLHLDGKINRDCLEIVKTRGGFHCLLRFDKLDKEYEKSWYKSLTGFQGCDVKVSDGLLPVVGCCQGNFIPHFVR